MISWSKAKQIDGHYTDEQKYPRRSTKLSLYSRFTCLLKNYAKMCLEKFKNILKRF